MKQIKYILGSFVAIFAAISMIGCTDEKVFSEDYDINFPRAVVDSISSVTDTIGKNVTIYGTDFRKISLVQISGIFDCKVVSIDTLNPLQNKIVVTIPRNAEKGPFVIKNLYRQTSQSAVNFTPIYLDASVTEWPTSIELGRSFKIKGVNADMINKVMVGGEVATISSATEDQVIVSTADMKKLTIGSDVTITVETRTANSVPASEPIPVVAPSDYYVPFVGYLLFDFETDVTVKDGGSGFSYTSGYNLNGMKGIGRCFSVKSPTSNAWDGVYCSIAADNEGKGYDLSEFNQPCLTFLVNTGGHDGYFSFDVTQGGTTEDKHIDGGWASKYGYADNYKITTNGWEWRSYKLSDFGFSANFKGKIDKFEFLIRGGNAGSPFEINLDQVLITDGLLNPAEVMTFEGGAPTFPDPSGIGSGGSPSYGLNKGTGSFIGSGYQGNNYFTVRGNDSYSGEYGSIISPSVSLSDFDKNYNSLYLNFLLNTGSADYGYFQLVIRQGSKWALKHFYGNPNYADSWSMNTNGKWQWRAIPLNPRNQKWDWDSDNNSGVQIDFAQPFTVEISFKNGEKPAYETNVDYFYMSNAPMSPTKYN